MVKFDIQNNQHVLLVTSWFGTLSESGEIDTIFMPSMRSLSFFIKEMGPPCELFFDLDDEGLFLCVWFSPFLSAACQGFWVRKDKRHSPGVFKRWIEVLQKAFLVYNTIIGLTKRPEILDMHVKLGYSISTVIPDLFEDKPGWLVHLHKSNFKYLNKKGKQDG